MSVKDVKVRNRREGRRASPVREQKVDWHSGRQAVHHGVDLGPLCRRRRRDQRVRVALQDGGQIGDIEKSAVRTARVLHVLDEVPGNKRHHRMLRLGDASSSWGRRADTGQDDRRWRRCDGRDGRGQGNAVVGTRGGRARRSSSASGSRSRSKRRDDGRDDHRHALKLLSDSGESGGGRNGRRTSGVVRPKDGQTDSAWITPIQVVAESLEGVVRRLSAREAGPGEAHPQPYADARACRLRHRLAEVLRILLREMPDRAAEEGAAFGCPACQCHVGQKNCLSVRHDVRGNANVAVRGEGQDDGREHCTRERA